MKATHANFANMKPGTLIRRFDNVTGMVAESKSGIATCYFTDKFRHASLKMFQVSEIFESNDPPDHMNGKRLTLVAQLAHMFDAIVLEAQGDEKRRYFRMRLKATRMSMEDANRKLVMALENADWETENTIKLDQTQFGCAFYITSRNAKTIAVVELDGDKDKPLVIVSFRNR